MRHVLTLGLVVALYFAPPFEHEVVVFSDAPYVMLVQGPYHLTVPVAWIRLFSPPRPTYPARFTTLTYLPTSAKWDPAHVFGMCQQRSLGIEFFRRCLRASVPRTLLVIERLRDSRLV